MVSEGGNFLNSLKPFFEVKFIVLLLWSFWEGTDLGGIFQGSSPPLPLFPLATLLLPDF